MRQTRLAKTLTNHRMRSKTLVALAVLFALAAPGSAKVRILVKNGKKIVYNDGVGEKRVPSARRSTDHSWLAARLSRPSEYDHLINQAASNHSLDPRLVKAVALVESGFNPKAVSPKGARGLMQLMPATARPLADLRGLAFEGGSLLDDPRANLEMGASFLAGLLKEFGDARIALAAYNAGPRRARDWWKARRTSDLEAWVEQIPFDETRHYVKRVTLSWEEYRRIYATLD